MTIYEAMTADNETVSLKEAAGRISASMVYIYPPDVPVIVAGEVIDEHMTEEVIRAAKRGSDILGLAGPDLIKVVKA